MQYAILILAFNYRRIPGLRELNVGRDMVGLGGFFQHVVGYDIVEIVQDQARETVLSQLDRLVARLNPGDMLVIYFGGHGLQTSEHLLVLPAGAADAAGSPIGFLPVGELRRRTEGRGLSRAMILDCCRNDDATTAPITSAAAAYSRRAQAPDAAPSDAARDVGVGTRPDAAADSVAGRPGRGSFAILCACSEDEIAPELGDTGEGLFSTALRNVLTGARRSGRPVRVDDALRAEVEEEMGRLAAAHGVGFTPQPWKAGNGTPEIMPVAIAETERSSGGVPPATGSLGAGAGGPVSLEEARRRAEEHVRRQAEETVRRRAEAASAEVRRRADAYRGLTARLAGELADGRLADAHQTVTELLGRRPREPEVLGVKSFLAEQQDSTVAHLRGLLSEQVGPGGDRSGAGRTIRSILRINPDDEAARGAAARIAAPWLTAAAAAAATVPGVSDRADILVRVADLQMATRDPAKALDSLRLARTAAAEISEDHLKGNACERIAEISARAGGVEDAKAAARLLRSDKRGGVFRDIAVARAKLGDAQGATAVVSLMGADDQGSAHQDVAKSLAAAGKVEEAKATARRIRDTNSLEYAYCAIAEVQVEAGDLDGAKQTAALISEGSARSEADFHIAEAQARAGDLAGAKATADRIQRDRWRAYAWRSIAEAAARSGDCERAKSIVATLDDAKARAGALRGIAVAQARSGDVKGALATAHGLSDPSEKSTAFLMIGREQLAGGDVAGAWDSFDAARTHTAEITSAPEQVSNHQSIAENQAWAGDVTGAMTTADGLVDARDRGYAYRGIANALARAGDVSRAKAIAAAAPDPMWRAVALRNVATAQAAAGDAAGAKAMVDGIDDAHQKVVAYALLAATQGKSGDVAGLNDWLQDVTDPKARALAHVGAASGLLLGKEPY